jgi:hypothetical protein
MRTSHTVALGAAVLAVSIGRADDALSNERAVAPPPRPVREYNAPAAKGERIPDRLNVGDPAPNFTLPIASTAKSKSTVTLSSFRGKKPVVLIFGSCT